MSDLRIIRDEDERVLRSIGERPGILGMTQGDYGRLSFSISGSWEPPDQHPDDGVVMVKTEPVWDDLIDLGDLLEGIDDEDTAHAVYSVASQAVKRMVEEMAENPMWEVIHGAVDLMIELRDGLVERQKELGWDWPLGDE